MTSKTTSQNIRVVTRFRPINSREADEMKKSGTSISEAICIEIEGRNVKIMGFGKDSHCHSFMMDDVLKSDVTQEEAFELIARDACVDVLQGFNGTIFAYGQTGSGKTYSMFGNEEEWDPKSSGIIPRAAHFFFHAINNSETIKEAEILVSFLEVYRGEVRDLNPDRTSEILKPKVRQLANGEVFVQNLRWEPVENLNEILRKIAVANGNRRVSATQMNKSSSRSHSLMSFRIKQKKRGVVVKAQMNFADLAGSEKVGKTGATGQALKEAQAINAGLTTLGRVISAIAKGRNPPFRDSKLTFILKDSIKGNTKTTLLLCCSPHRFNREETLATFRFGASAKKIKNNCTVNKSLSVGMLKKLAKELEKENKDLRVKIADLEKRMMNESIQTLPSLADFSSNASTMQNNLTPGLADIRRSVLVTHAKPNQALLPSAASDKLKMVIESKDLTIKELQANCKKLEGERDEFRILAQQLQEDRNTGADENLTSLKNENNSLREKLQESEDICERLRTFTHALTNTESMRQGSLNKAKVRRAQKEIEDKLGIQVMVSSSIIATAYEESKSLLKLARQSARLEQQIKELKTKYNDLTISFDNLEEEKFALEEELAAERVASLECMQPEPILSIDDLPVPHHKRVTSLRKDTEVLTYEVNEACNYFNEMSQDWMKRGKTEKEHSWQAWVDARGREIGWTELDNLKKDPEKVQELRKEFEKVYDPLTRSFTLKATEDDIKEARDSLLGSNATLKRLNRGQKVSLNNLVYSDLPDKEELSLNEEATSQLIDDPWDWSVEDVSRWLMSVQLEQYADIFKEDMVDGRLLITDISDTDELADLNVKKIHMEKIMREIEFLRSRSPMYDIYQEEHQEVKADGEEHELKIDLLTLPSTVPGLRELSASLSSERGLVQEQTNHLATPPGALEISSSLSCINMRGSSRESHSCELTDPSPRGSSGDSKKLGIKDGERLSRPRRSLTMLNSLGDLFSKLTVKKGGKLTIDEFSTGLDSLGVDFTSRKVENIFMQLDKGGKGYITVNEWLGYLSCTDVLTMPRRRRTKLSIHEAIPKLAEMRKQFVERGAMVIKYSLKHNKPKKEIADFLLRKGLTKDEIRESWRMLQRNEAVVPDIAVAVDGDKNFDELKQKVAKQVRPFDDFRLLKIMRRAGLKSNRTYPFNDLETLREAGLNGRIDCINFWYDENKSYFRGMRVDYLTEDGLRVEAGKHFAETGSWTEIEFPLTEGEFIIELGVWTNIYIMGLRFLTSKREEFFGSKKGASSVFKLIAPKGSGIIAFYGSMGTLLESIGCYVLRLDQPARMARRERSKVLRSKVLRPRKWYQDW